MGRMSETRRLVAALMFVASGSTASAAEYEIAIINMKFGASPAALRVGDVIVWRNNDMFRHTATARDGTFDIDLPPKTSRRMTVGHAGDFAYYCRFHRGMVGRLEVGQ